MGIHLWRFSNATPLIPISPFWLVPIRIVAGEPCLEQGVGKPKVKLEVFQKIHIEDNVEVIPELDFLFIVPASISIYHSSNIFSRERKAPGELE